MLFVAIMLGSVLPHLRAETLARSTTQTAGDRAVPSTYFGLNTNINFVTEQTWPAVPFGSWRTFRGAWWRLEPERDRWDFTVLDNEVELAKQHNVDLDIVLTSVPTWAARRPEERAVGQGQTNGIRSGPAKIEDWVEYLKVVATRYKGRVRTYELWNEPDENSSYTGDIPSLVALCKASYSALKSVDPGITVVSPSVAASGIPMLNQFLADGGGESFDVLGYHPYTLPKEPERMVKLIAELRACMARNEILKPIWGTETGYPIRSSPSSVHNNQRNYTFKVAALDEQTSIAYVARLYILGWAIGFERLYWYAYDDYIFGLADDHGLNPKRATAGYASAYKWVLGSVMRDCSADAAQTWTCTITKYGGYVGHIVWNPQQPTRLLSVRSWNPTTVRQLSGDEAPFDSHREYYATGTPVLFESNR